MRRRQPFGLDALDHRERGADTRSRVTKMEHHSVAQPLDRPATVRDGGPLHESRQISGELRGCLVAALLCQPRVPGDVEKAHRRWPVQPALDAGVGDGRLDDADDVRAPCMCLVGVIDHQQRLVDLSAEPGGHLRSCPLTDLDDRHARRRLSPDDIDPPQLARGVGNPSETVADDPEDPLHRCRAIADQPRTLQQRHQR